MGARRARGREAAVTAPESKQLIDYLRNYYADREGRLRELNDVQWHAFTKGLAPFSVAEGRAAADAWIKRSKFFPALSELLELLHPVADSQAQAHLAWTTVERAIRSAGAYRGVTFVNGAIGETVKQVFGTWPMACQFDLDSPGWAIRRQTFLQVFPVMQARDHGRPVTLRGMGEIDAPMAVGAVVGLPAPTNRRALEDPALTHGEAVKALADIKQRALAQKATA
jgi:hypothetical protein